MEHLFFQKKIYDKIPKYAFYLFYSGYHLTSFINPLISKLTNEAKGTVYLLNFNESIIDYIENAQTHKSLKANSKKKKNHSIISIPDKVLLLELISNKISKDSINALIIGPHFPIEPDSKIIFLMKILHEYPIKILHISNDPYSFYRNLHIFISRIGIRVNNSNDGNYHNNDKKQFTIKVIPRNHAIVNKIITHNLNFHQVTIKEYNISSNRRITRLLHELLNIGIDELVNVVSKSKEIQMKIKDWFYNSLIISKTGYSDDYYSLFYNNTNAYKAKVLLMDVFHIKSLLNRSDEYDYASLLRYYNSITRRDSIEELSLFNYQDIQTSTLICEIGEELKLNLFEVKKCNNIQTNSIGKVMSIDVDVDVDMIDIDTVIDNDSNNHHPNESFSSSFSYLNQFLDLISINNSHNVNSYKEILTNYYLKKHYNYTNIDLVLPKLYQLISLLTKIQTNKQSEKPENILIIVNSSYLVDNIKEALVSHFNLNDSFKYYTDNQFRNYLISKPEFVRRQKVINANYSAQTQSNPKSYSKFYIENVLLQYECYCLCQSSNHQNAHFFEKIYAAYKSSNDPQKLLPSQIEIEEEEFVAFANICFNEKKILEPHFVCVECYKAKSDEDRLISDITIKKINHVILYSEDIELLRLVESIPVDNKNNAIKQITKLTEVSSYQFYIQMKRHESDNNIFHKLTTAFSIDDKNDTEDCSNCDMIIDSSKGNKEDSLNQQIKCESKDEEALTNATSNTILIDYREMSAKTPYYLYESGFKIVSSSLEIGDYIPSNSVCIERKSISTHDLHQSLKSTRLTNQIVKMEKYYDYIIILCEFDNILEAKELFKKDLFTQRELYKNMIDLKNISKKILYAWTVSPSMTAKLIQLIKNRQSGYFDIDKCLNANKPGRKTKMKVASCQTVSSQKSIMNMFNKDKDKDKEKDKIDDDEEEEEEGCINNSNNNKDIDNSMTIIDDNNKRLKISIEKFIRKIDGVTSINYPIVINNFKNLRDFIMCPRHKLFELFGRINGNKINLFLTTKYQPPE